MRLVFDTNVIVSAALLAGSTPRQAFDKGLTEGIVLISVPVLLELAEVLGREKFNKYLLVEERLRFLVALLKEVELAEVTEVVAECRDPHDNKFLELALCGKADLIISGDNDLLTLNPFRGISIIAPQEFLSVFQRRLTFQHDLMTSMHLLWQ